MNVMPWPKSLGIGGTLHLACRGHRVWPGNKRLGTESGGDKPRLEGCHSDRTTHCGRHTACICGRCLVDTLRDSVIVAYGAFAFIVVALLLERPERLQLIIRFLRTIGSMSSFWRHL